MAETTRLVTYASTEFDIGRNIRRWADSVERGFVLNAKIEAPQRTGELRAGIWGEVNRIGPKMLETVIHSDAPHSLYVLKGTTGPIMSNRMFGFRGNERYAHLEVPRGGALSGNPLWGQTRGYDMGWLHSHGYALKLRPGNGFGTKYMLQVRGQDANNFFARAADITARTHSSLRGFAPRFGY